ncbi:glycosyltransferase family 4 protein [Plectonema radiosum NIES-515]|uniref:Glycosyltransferase family 4 protein n=1 Tax=Plectonema radiosum NIES-515 TaxID=2986073 RepID=A0ABT3AXK3_9CYAN|nr:glycosyltransferase family 4 protein [Plectonema radiosum]MCV3213854.1 glycosyltransferase family 4 protein [Plectonema radiosum NIES-515]
MSKILFISAHAPTNEYPQAGQKIAFKNLEEYASYGIVDVVVIANQAEIIAGKDLREKYSDRLYTHPLFKLNKISACLTYFQIPFKFSSRRQTAVIKKLQELLKQNTYDIIHFEYSHAAVYLDLIEPQINSKQTKTIISIHDVVSQSFLRKAENNLILGIEVARIFHYEKTLYSTANELWVLSQKDRDILTSLFSIPQERIIVKPPQLSNFIYQVKRHPEKIEKKSLLFWAAMSRPENEQAILTFVENCFSKLRQKDPEFKLYIVGSSPTKKVLALKSDNIIVTGFALDPTAFFEKAEIGIVPLLKGAGIKLKTLEMLEAGLPVISTSVGAEGVYLTGKKLVVNDNFDEWVNLISCPLN